MKKVIIWLITAVVLLVAGASVMALSVIKYGPESYYADVETHKSDYEFDAPVTEINVNTVDGDVYILPSDSDVCHVSCIESDRQYNFVEMRDGVLSVTSHLENRLEIDYLPFTEPPSVTIYIPSSEYNDLIINVTHGDVRISNLVFDSIDITAITGDVLFDMCDANEIVVNVTTGDVEGTLLSGKVFDAHTVTGDVDVPENSDGGTCTVSLTTGDVSIDIA